MRRGPAGSIALLLSASVCAVAQQQATFAEPATVDLPNVSTYTSRQLFVNEGRLVVLSQGAVDTVTFDPDRGQRRSRVPIGAPYPAFAVYADLNGDGVPDIAGLDLRTLIDPELTVLLGEPDAGAMRRIEGSMRLPGSYLYSDAADLDGDGLMDIVYAQPEQSMVTVLQGAGGGAFRIAGRYSASRAFYPALLRRQGAPGFDLFVSDGGAGIWRLSSSGVQFGETQLFYAAQGIGYLTAVPAEDRGAGAVELLATRADGKLLVFSGGNTVPAEYDCGGYAPGAIAVGDLDHDGLPDAVVAVSGAARLAIFYGLGAATPPVRVMIPVDPLPLQVKLADLDGDGWLDIVSGSFSAPVKVLWNTTSTSTAIPSAQHVPEDSRGPRAAKR